MKGRSISLYLDVLFIYGTIPDWNTQSNFPIRWKERPENISQGILESQNRFGRNQKKQGL
jgi:hypothetical protein